MRSHRILSKKFTIFLLNCVTSRSTRKITTDSFSRHYYYVIPLQVPGKQQKGLPPKSRDFSKT